MSGLNDIAPNFDKSSYAGNITKVREALQKLNRNNEFSTISLGNSDSGQVHILRFFGTLPLLTIRKMLKHR